MRDDKVVVFLLFKSHSSDSLDEVSQFSCEFPLKLLFF